MKRRVLKTDLRVKRVRVSKTAELSNRNDKLNEIGRVLIMAGFFCIGRYMGNDILKKKWK